MSIHCIEIVTLCIAMWFFWSEVSFWKLLAIQIKVWITLWCSCFQFSLGFFIERLSFLIHSKHWKWKQNMAIPPHYILSPLLEWYRLHSFLWFPSVNHANYCRAVTNDDEAANPCLKTLLCNLSAWCGFLYTYTSILIVDWNKLKWTFSI